MPTKFDSKKSRIDGHYDDAFNKSSAQQLKDAENSRLSEIADNIKSVDADASQEDAAIERAKEILGTVKKKESSTSDAWANEVTPDKSKGGNKFGLRKAGGPMGIILTLIIGGAGTVSFFGGPGLLIVNLAEKLNEKFNYQLTTMHIRTNKIIEGKIKNTTTGVCAPVTWRCSYATFSDKELANFKNAGIDIVPDSKTAITGRNKIASITFKGDLIKPEEFLKRMKTDIAFNAAVKQGFNPKYSGMSDAVFSKKAADLRLSKKSPFTDADRASDETRLKRMDDETRNGRAAGDINTTESADCDAECRSKQTDTKSQLDNAVSDSETGTESQTTKALKQLDAGDIGNVAGSAASLVKVTGVVDNACVVYGMFKAVSIGVKTLRSSQMARFAMMFLVTAGMIKAGDAVAEDVAFLGTMLTKTFVVDSGDGMTTTTTKPGTDSFGYRYTAFGDSGIAKDTNAMQALAGAGTTGALEGALAYVLSVLGGKQQADTTCNINNNIITQGASFAVGIFLWIVPGGQPIALAKLGTQGAFTAATFAAQLLLPALLADIIAGRLIDGNTVGETAMNFIVSGAGHLHSQLAQAGGDGALNPEQAAELHPEAEKVAQEYRALDRYTHSPFDASNPNTFLGSIYTQFAPYFIGTPSSLLQLSSIPASIVGSTFANITPTASASAASFRECTDPDYLAIGIATDPFCNPIFGTPIALAMDDTDAVNQRLADKGLLDDNGNPAGDYAAFVTNCINRGIPLGNTGEDSGADIGEVCFMPNKAKEDLTIEEQTLIDMRVHYVDQRLIGPMENGYGSGISTPNNTDPATPIAPDPTFVDTPSKDGWSVPIKNNGRISLRWHVWASKGLHKGLDFPAIRGTPVTAAHDGTVTSVRNMGSCGYATVISALGINGLFHAYQHMDPSVKVGEAVKRGQVIGYVGTFCGTGTHLHFSIETANRVSPYVGRDTSKDPEDYLPL